MTPGALPADEVEAANASELEGAGAEAVTIQDRERIAGSEATHISARFNVEGLVYLTEHYSLSSAENTYVITFSFSDTVSEAGRQATAESVLASWMWA